MLNKTTTLALATAVALVSGCIVVPTPTATSQGKQGSQTTPKRPTPQASDEPTTIMVDLEHDIDVIPILARGAQRAGCTYEHQMKDGASVLAVGCEGHLLAFAQKERRLLTLCNDLEQKRCGEVAGKILELGAQ